MKRRQFVISAAAASVAACARVRSTLKRIRISVLPRFIMAPVYLADELGFFRDAGLELDIRPLASTTEMIPLLAAGELDVAFASAIPAALNAIAKGARSRIVAAREIAVPGCIREVYGNRHSFPGGLNHASELKGKRVAVSARTSLSAFLLDTFLASAGLETKDVQLLPMVLTESAPALAGGKIDAVVDKDMEFRSPEIIPGLSIAEILPGFQYTYIHFGRSLCDGPEESGAAFLAAYFRGVREFRAGKTPATFDHLAAGGGMDPEVVKTACRTRIHPDGRIDPASVQRMIDWGVRKGFIESPMLAAQAIDARFLDRAQAKGT